MKTRSHLKKLSALILALLTAFAVIPVSALGVSEKDGEDYAFVSPDGDYALLGEDSGLEPDEGTPEDHDYNVIQAKLPGGDGSAARTEFEERMISTHGSQAIDWDPDGNGAYYGDYILIYNPTYNGSSKSTGTLTGLIETSTVDHLGSPAQGEDEERGHEEGDLPCRICGACDIIEEGGISAEPPHDAEPKETLTFNVGDTHDFTLLDKYCVVSNNVVNFTCYAKGTHCYVWSPTDKTANRFYPLDQIDSTYAQTFANEFDAQFDTMADAFGSHWNGEQGDGRVNLMFYNLKDTTPGATICGFFSPSDYTNNGMPMVNIDTMPCLTYTDSSGHTQVLPASAQFNTMVHEYQHQIHYSVCRTYDKSTESWLTEMMSAAAEEICYPGSSLSDRIQTWIGEYDLAAMANDPYYEVKSPGYDTQTGQALYTWDRNSTGANHVSQYSKVSLYAQYLYSHNSVGNQVFKTILWEYAAHPSYTSGDAMNAVMNDNIIFSNNDLTFLNRYFWIATVLNPSSGSSFYGNFGFKMQDGYDPSEYYGIQNLYNILCPVVYTGSRTTLGGGSSIVVKPKDGRFIPPSDAASGLEYIGIFTNERLHADTVKGYENTMIYTDLTNYPWVYSDGAAKSVNAGKANSSAFCAYYSYPSAGVGAIRFRCKVDGEDGSNGSFYDGLRVYLDSRDADHLQYEIASTNGQWENYELVIPEGYYGTVIWFEYVKDGSVNNGEDCAYIDDVEFINRIDYQLKASYNTYYAHFITDGYYPWVYNSDGYVKSTNEGVANSESAIQCTVTVNAGDVFFFSFDSFGEESSAYGIVYDGLSFYVNGVKANTWGVTDNARYLYFYSSGTYTLKWVYFKDGSEDPVGDCARLARAYVITAPSSSVINTIRITGYRTPSVGERAYDIISQVGVPADANYRIGYIAFYCDTDGDYIPNYREFEAGKQYSLCIRVEPIGSPHFAASPSVLINGSTAELDTGYCSLDTTKGQYIVWTKPRTASSSVLMGDVDGSGVVNANDALMVMRYSLGLISSMPVIAAADVNNDGVINANDALRIMRYALGLISSL